MTNTEVPQPAAADLATGGASQPAPVPSVPERRISDERLRNTRAWAAARVGSLSGADVIVGAIDELFQARGSLTLAEDGLTSYALEVERKNSLIDTQDAAQTSLHAENVRLRVENERLQKQPPQRIPPRQFDAESHQGLYTEAAHEPLEQLSPSEASSFHKTLARSSRVVSAPKEITTIDEVAAICHAVTGVCCHILGSPGGPCTIHNCAAVRGYLRTNDVA